MSKYYIISYDMAEGGNYDALYDAIEGYGNCAHVTESTWIVKTEWSAGEIVADLDKYLPEGSRLFVAEAGDDADGRNLLINPCF